MGGRVTVTANVVHTHHLDGAQTILLSTGHEIQFGYGDGGDGFCYAHQSFNCIESLTDDEKRAIKDAA
jgi:hypothetical protein